jgi:hypothetical protein
MSDCNYTETPLPELRAILMARHPGVEFDCMLSTLNDETVQRISFRGRRKYLSSFAPARAFKDDALHSSCDVNGDKWTVYPEVGHRANPDLLDRCGLAVEAELFMKDEAVIWCGWVHVSVDALETPPCARRWPQKGVEAQVDRMLRKVVRRPRESASG